MSNVEIFKNEEFGTIRTVVIGNEPWFVGRDVAVALGYENTRKAIADHVDDEDKLQNDGVTICDSMGRAASGCYQRIWFIQLDSRQQARIRETFQAVGNVRSPSFY